MTGDVTPLYRLGLANAHWGKMYGGAHQKIKAASLMILLVGAEIGKLRASIDTMIACPNCQGEQWHSSEENVVASPASQQQVKCAAEQMARMMIDPNIQNQATHVAQRMELMMADTNSLELSRRVAKQMESMVADPNVKEQAERIAERMEATMRRSYIAQKAKLTSEQKEGMNADAIFLERTKLFARQIEFMMADYTYQEQAKRFALEIVEMQADPHIQQHARRFEKHMELLTRDPSFQVLARHINVQMGADSGNHSLHEQTSCMLNHTRNMMIRPWQKKQDKLIFDQRMRSSAGRLVDKVVGNIISHVLDQALKASSYHDIEDIEHAERAVQMVAQGSSKLPLVSAINFGAALTQLNTLKASENWLDHVVAGLIAFSAVFAVFVTGYSLLENYYIPAALSEANHDKDAVGKVWNAVEKFSPVRKLCRDSMWLALMFLLAADALRMWKSSWLVTLGLLFGIVLLAWTVSEFRRAFKPLMGTTAHFIQRGSTVRNATVRFGSGRLTKISSQYRGSSVPKSKPSATVMDHMKSDEAIETSDLVDHITQLEARLDKLKALLKLGKEKPELGGLPTAELSKLDELVKATSSWLHVGPSTRDELISKISEVDAILASFARNYPAFTIASHPHSSQPDSSG